MPYPRYFESLGDNCEFGFVQRMNGLEPGGLLRWAISPPDPLISNIHNDFEGIFQFANLIPHTDKMISDRKSGLKFHSRMESKEGKFILGDRDLLEVYKEEWGKISYLKDKLINDFKFPSKHFVYKHNSGISQSKCHRLAEVISSKGPGRILVIHAAEGGKIPGSVERVSDCLYFGFVSEFAKYQSANKFDLSCWMEVIENAVRIMPTPAAIDKY